MNEEVDMVMMEAEESMEKAIHHLESELSKIRAGKADTKMLHGIMVDYYGTMTPLNQVSNINTPDPRTIAVQPWEKNMIQPIEKAIQAANLGLNPENNGEIIRINVPPLTEERRRDLVKQSKNEAENARISIRAARHKANDEFKRMLKEGLPEDMEKDALDRIQKLTDKYNSDVEAHLTKKEKDIMTI